MLISTSVFKRGGVIDVHNFIFVHDFDVVYEPDVVYELDIVLNILGSRRLIYFLHVWYKVTYTKMITWSKYIGSVVAVLDSPQRKFRRYKLQPVLLLFVFS